MGAVFRWIKYIYEWVKNFMIGGLDAYLKGMLGYPVQYHVSKDGLDTNNGLSWSKAFLTIQAGLDAVGDLEGRGSGIVLVGPGHYPENLITPLNTEGPFGILRAASPSKRSTGAVWLSSPVATSPILTIRARGWLIDGFEFDAPATDGCILLDGVTDDSDPRFTEIANCLFNGGYSANDFGIDTNHIAPLVVIRDCMFLGFGGRAITSTDCYALEWELARLWFENCQNYIYPKNSKGFQQSWIHDCNFNHVGGNYTATVKCDMRGGAQNHVGPNNFMGGTYDHAGGYYESGSDRWWSNHTEDGHTYANPAA